MEKIIGRVKDMVMFYGVCMVGIVIIGMLVGGLFLMDFLYVLLDVRLVVSFVVLLD